MSLLAHGSGDWHDLWLTATPFVVSAVLFLVLRARMMPARTSNGRSNDSGVVAKDTVRHRS